MIEEAEIIFQLE